MATSQGFKSQATTIVRVRMSLAERSGFCLVFATTGKSPGINSGLTNTHCGSQNHR